MKRLLFLLFLIGLPGSASGQSLDKYYVSGASTQELRASIKRRGPGNATGTTQIQFSYSYKARSKNGISRAVEPVVRRKIVFRMPYWRGYHSASACLQRSWTAMYANLSRHEIHHARLSDGVEARIKNAIRSVRPQKSVALLDLAVKRDVGKILRAHSAAQAKFDRDTDHGRKDPQAPIVFATCR